MDPSPTFGDPSHIETIKKRMIKLQGSLSPHQAKVCCITILFSFYSTLYYTYTFTIYIYIYLYICVCVRVCVCVCVCVSICICMCIYIY